MDISRFLEISKIGGAVILPHIHGHTISSQKRKIKKKEDDLRLQP